MRRDFPSMFDHTLVCVRDVQGLNNSTDVLNICSTMTASLNAFCRFRSSDLGPTRPLTLPLLGTHVVGSKFLPMPFGQYTLRQEKRR